MDEFRVIEVKQNVMASNDAEADELGVSVRERCLSMPDPQPSEMFAHVYAEEHPVITREQAWFSEYHATFEEEGAR